MLAILLPPPFPIFVCLIYILIFFVGPLFYLFLQREEEQIMMEEKYSDLAEEAQVKTRKLEKLFARYKAARYMLLVFIIILK